MRRVVALLLLVVVLAGCSRGNWRTDLEPGVSDACKARIAEELDADPGDVTMYLNEGSSGGDSTTISGNAFADASGLRAYLCYVVRDAGRWVVKDFDLGARQ